jgi:drug/metabolite transporter (DMT)-like permease
MKNFPVFVAVVSAVLFGVATPISKLLLAEMNYFQLAGLLYLGAAAGLLPFAFKKDKLDIWQIDRRNFLRILGAMIFGGIFGPVLLLMGLKMANASSVSLWLNLELAATAVLGVVFFKDHLDLKGWLGVSGALLAGVLITFHEGHSGILAGLFVAIACISWGLDNHFTALIDALTPSQITFLKGFFAGTINFAVGVSLTTSLPSLEILGAAIGVGIFSYGVSIVLYIIAAQILGATRSQILFASAPFFGAFFSVVLLSESISLIQIVAAVILAFSIVSIILGTHSHYHLHDELEHIHMHHHDDLHHAHGHATEHRPSKHVHMHKHKKDKHAHAHYPDLHHRHDHKEDTENHLENENSKR